MGKLKRLATIVLCGGASRRMGYPKALLPIGNELMVERVCRLAAEVSDQIILVKSQGQILPELPSQIKIVEDTISFQGPLVGMRRGLEVVDLTIDLAFITAVDTPLLKPDLIRYLLNQISNTDYDLIMPFDEEHLYPLAAIYRIKPVLTEINNLLSQNKFRPVFLMDHLKGLKIPLDALRSTDPNLESFQNINTRSEYRSLISQLNLNLEPAFEPKTCLVEFYGTTRLITRIDSCRIQCDLYDDLIQSLELKFPDLKNHVIFDGRLHRAFRLVRNGSDFIDDFQKSPEDGDSIMLISADVGG